MTAPDETSGLAKPLIVLHIGLLVLWEFHRQFGLHERAVDLGTRLLRVNLASIYCLVGLAGVVVGMVLLSRQDRVHAVNTAAVWLLGYGLVAMVVVVNSPDPIRSSLQARWQVGWSSQLAALSLLLLSLARSERGWWARTAAGALLATFAIRLTQMLASVRYMDTAPPELYPPWLTNPFNLWRYHSIAPNSAGMAAGFLCLVGISQWHRCRSRLARVVLVAALMALVSVMIIAQARVPALFVAGVVLARALHKRLTPRLLIICGAAVVGTTLLTFATSRSLIGLTARLNISRSSWGAILDAPILGNGFGFATREAMLANGSRRLPHNSFFQAMVTNGVIGGALVVGAFICLWWQVAKRTRASGDDVIVQLALFLTACAFVYSNVGTWADAIRNAAFGIVALLALCPAELQLTDRRDRLTRRTHEDPTP